MSQQGRRYQDTAIMGSAVLHLTQHYSNGIRTQHEDKYFIFSHYLLDNKMVFQLINVGTSVYTLRVPASRNADRNQMRLTAGQTREILMPLEV